MRPRVGPALRRTSYCSLVKCLSAWREMAEVQGSEGAGTQLADAQAWLRAAWGAGGDFPWTVINRKSKCIPCSGRFWRISWNKLLRALRITVTHLPDSFNHWQADAIQLGSSEERPSKTRRVFGAGTKLQKLQWETQCKLMRQINSQHCDCVLSAWEREKTKEVTQLWDQRPETLTLKSLPSTPIFSENIWPCLGQIEWEGGGDMETDKATGSWVPDFLRDQGGPWKTWFFPPLTFMKPDVAVMLLKCQPVSSQDFPSAPNCPLYHRHYQVNGAPPPPSLPEVDTRTCQAMDPRARVGAPGPEFLCEGGSKPCHLPGRSEQGLAPGCAWVTPLGRL